MEMEKPKKKAKLAKVKQKDPASNIAQVKVKVQPVANLKLSKSTIQSPKPSTASIKGSIVPLSNDDYDGSNRSKRNSRNQYLEQTPLYSETKKFRKETTNEDVDERAKQCIDEQKEKERKRKERDQKEKKHFQEVVESVKKKKIVQHESDMERSLSLLESINDYENGVQLSELEEAFCVKEMEKAKKSFLTLRLQNEKAKLRDRERVDRRDAKLYKKLALLEEQVTNAVGNRPFRSHRQGSKSPLCKRKASPTSNIGDDSSFDYNEEAFKCPVEKVKKNTPVAKDAEKTDSHEEETDKSPVDTVKKAEVFKCPVEKVKKNTPVAKDAEKTDSHEEETDKSLVDTVKKPEVDNDAIKTMMSDAQMEQHLQVLSRLWDEKKDKAAAMELARKLQNSLGPWQFGGGFPVDYTNMVKDKLTSKFIRKFLTDMKSYTPLATTGNGSCLFNALSLILFGTEAFALELRLRTSIYQILHEEELTHMQKTCPWGRNCYDDFDREVSVNLDINGFSNSLTMLVLSKVTDTQITSVFPFIEGHTNLENKVDLSTTFNSEVSKHSKRKVVIMWTGCVDLCKDFRINHFVPLISKQEMELKGIPKKPCIVDLVTNVEKEVEKKLKPEVDYQDAMDVTSSSDQTSSSVEESSSACEESQSKLKVSEEENLDGNDDDVHDDDVHEKSHASTASGSTIRTLTSYMWLPMEKVVRIAQKRESIKMLPLGPKGSRAFLVKNVRNHEIFKAKLRQNPKGPKSKGGPKMSYCDDRHAYKSPSQNYYLHELREDQMVLLRSVKLGEDGICTLNGDALEVQPGKENIFVSKFSYHQSKSADSDFAKRTIEFMIVPPSHKDIEGLAVVEYKGKDPKGALHGNATKVQYVYFLSLFCKKVFSVQSEVFDFEYTPRYAELMNFDFAYWGQRGELTLCIFFGNSLRKFTSDIFFQNFDSFGNSLWELASKTQFGNLL
jgi:hypothetical protein